MPEREDPTIALVARLTAAFGLETDRRHLDAPVPWPDLPDVGSLIRHVGSVHRWVSEILRTRGAIARDAHLTVPASDLRRWYEQGCGMVLEALAAVPPETPCWIIGDRIGTAAFWRRRMVYENVKHLIDLRASGGGVWQVAPELTSDDYADGVDELFEVFLPRSLPALRPLPGPLRLLATDTGRSWSISQDWEVSTTSGDDGGSESGQISARAGDLALTVWERADPLRDPRRFRVEGDLDTVAAFVSASIHPW